MSAQPFDPKKALQALLSAEEKALFDQAKNTMTDVEKTLAKKEWEGDDTSYARAALYQLDYWTSCTADAEQVRRSLTHLKHACARTDPPGALTQDAGGSFGCGTDVWFLKLDRSTDQVLAREWPWPRPPMFLERISDPVRMVTYLEDLSWSDIARCRRDNRKELNLAISVIARLVMQNGQKGYLSGPGFYPAFEQFVQDWQDPQTGFFGMTYITDANGNTVRTTDLSLTFHMAHYVPHLIRWWPKLIDTLLAIKDGVYPQGWRDRGTVMSDHNNYDVVELFYRGWNRIEPHQRVAASAAVKDLFDWCLGPGGSVRADGNLMAPDPSDPIPDSFYFAAAFLDSVGFFDVSKRFWTSDRLPDPTAIKTGMTSLLKTKFSPYYTEIDDALTKLGASDHPWTSAML